MKPLLILVALCGFAVPQTVQAPSLQDKSTFVWSYTHPLEITQGRPTIPLASEPPIVAPKMHDVVTHTKEFGCEKGYDQWYLSPSSNVRLTASWTRLTDLLLMTY